MILNFSVPQPFSPSLCLARRVRLFDPLRGYRTYATVTVTPAIEMSEILRTYEGLSILSYFSLRLFGDTMFCLFC
jgi:hypothetical protein